MNKEGSEAFETAITAWVQDPVTYVFLKRFFKVRQVNLANHLLHTCVHILFKFFNISQSEVEEISINLSM